MVHNVSALHKRGISEFKDNYAHVINGLMERNQGVV